MSICFTTGTTFNFFLNFLTCKDNVLICRILSDFFEEGFRINSRKYISGEAFYVCLSGKDKVKRVVDLIKPFVPQSMIYKIKDYIA